MLAYLSIEKAKEEQAITVTALNNSNLNESHYIPEMSCSLVEKLVKKSKCHRSIADSEKGYIKSLIHLMGQTSKNLS